MINIPLPATVGSPYRLTQLIIQWWGGRRLAHQFLIAAAIVLVPAMGSMGWWVSSRIAQAVVENTAHAAALYMEGSVAPLIQELSTSRELSLAARKELDALMVDPNIRERIISMKVWLPDGTIVYSTWPEVIGKKFAPSASFKKAAAGGLGAEFNSELHEEDALERQSGKPLLEIYAPVRSHDLRTIIAISEFYADGAKLQSDIDQTALLSWLVMAGVTFAMLTALFGIVYRGSQTIDNQRFQLTDRIGELRGLLAQNEELRGRLQRSSENISDMTERMLQRLGADLHDGPAQLLTYALLRLSKLAPLIDDHRGGRGADELKRMRDALEDTLREVRNLSEGLTLPELNAVTLEQAIVQAVAWHEQHTNTKVIIEIDPLPDVAPHSLKVCVYRFVQEGLANAFHHAGAAGQRVVARARNDLVLSVHDTGPGMVNGDSEGLGLLGLRARVEAAGGHLKIESNPETGTCLTASFEQRTV